MKTTLRLTQNGVWALHFWLKTRVLKTPGNYYQEMIIRVLADLWKKKVHPKTAAMKPNEKIRLTEIETLALAISFMYYDLLDAPTLLQSQLHYIRDQLPPLRWDEEDRWIPPQLEIEYTHE